jgi:hypothetical protein
MNYKLIKDIEDTWFYEFYPGKINGNRPHYDSVYISSDAFPLIGDCLHRANNNFEACNYTEYTKKKGQIQLLAEELRFQLAEIMEDKDLSKRFSPELIADLKKYRTEIIEMINDLIKWIENLKENELTVITDFDKFLTLINCGD